MFKNETVALVIATYKSPRSLRLVFESVLKQSMLPDQVSIADDGSGKSTKAVIDEFRSLFPVPVKHFGIPMMVSEDDYHEQGHCGYTLRLHHSN
jgi:glycosyltransferase involved in cell wall biosynthesis